MTVPRENKRLELTDSQLFPEAGAKVAFAVKLARTLHEYGTPTHRLEQIMDQVTRRIGLEGQFFLLPTGIFLSFGAPEEQRSTAPAPLSAVCPPVGMVFLASRHANTK